MRTSRVARGSLGTFTRGGVLLGLVGVAATSCGVEGDPNWVPPVPTIADPRVGTLSNRCVRPFADGTCAPDVLPPLVNCAAAEAGVEFLSPAVFDFASVTSTLYSYSDGTSEFLEPSGYEPPLFTGSTRCGIDLNADGVLEPDPNKAGELHLWGGPFREWGGGMGRSMQGYAAAVGCPSASMGTPADDGTAPCPPLDERIEAIPAASLGGEGFRTEAYERLVDVRDWDGISFWARIGPGSDPGFRISLGDRQLDEDIAYLETEAYKQNGNQGPGPLCGRVLECGCRNHRPCTLDTVLNESYCYDPALGDVAPNVLAAALPTDATVDDFPYFFPYEKCGATMCDSNYEAFTRIDPIFTTAAQGGTASCQPYTFDNDFTADYCYDAADPLGLAIAPAYERCGDVWAKPVGLTPQWQFFKVPFTELRQEGWGKEFQYLDLSKIALVRFTWAVGWIDFWVDDVRFYRTPRPAVTN
ncbi:MAG: hypothetical protein ABW217_09260 [Polyangiaceae bacterium]